MKRQLARKIVAQSAANTKKSGRAQRKFAREKWDKSAQMPNYLLEEHPELGK